MRAAPTPSRIRTRARTGAIQPSVAQPTRRLLDRRIGTPSARHALWLGKYQDWQYDAKRYARTIGVVRFASNIVASTAGRVNLIVEQRNEAGDWVETEDKQLRALLPQYGNETFGQTANELVRLHTWHYQVAGEAVICNKDDTQGAAEWLITSMDAIEWDKPQKDLATIRFHPGGVVNDGTAIVLPRDQMLRYWMPDEEWLGLATSPLTSVMDDIRRYRSLVRYAQRQAESYLAMNGMLWSTEKPHVKPSSGDETEHEGQDPTAKQESTPFELYNEWAQLSINDDDSLAAVIPPWIWFGESGDKPEMIDLVGGLDEHGPEHRSEALQDIGRGVDSPMSLVSAGGANEENHWGAWITQERFVAAVAPTLDRVTHQDMTVAFLYPLMRLMGRTDMRSTRIGYDATPVIVHPDMSDKALRGWLAGLVGSEAAREKMGFDPNDKPTPQDEELLAKVLSNFGGGGGGAAAPGGGPHLPSIKAPGEKVGPATVQETGPKQPQPSGTGSPLGLAASILGDYVPSNGGTIVWNGDWITTTTTGSTSRTAASMNAGQSGVMIALPVPTEVQGMAVADGEPPESMHMTLLYFGDCADCAPSMQSTLRGICSAIASNSQMPQVDLSHVEQFMPTPSKQPAAVTAAGMDMGGNGNANGNGQSADDSGGMSGMGDMDMCPCCLVDDGPDVPALVEQLKTACDAAGVPYREDHAFRSHVTLGYWPQGEGPEPGPLDESMSYSPDALMLHWGDEVDAYPFVDAPEAGARTATLTESRFARRAFTSETFDESLVRRDRGRFATKEGDAADALSQPDPKISQTWDRMPDDQKQAVLDQAAKHRLDYDEMHARAGALLDYAFSPDGKDQQDKGMGWYSRMRDLADERAAASGLTREEYLGLVAATSPRMQWDWENFAEDDPRKYPNLNAADLMAKLWNENRDLTVAQYVADQALVNPTTGKAAYAPRDLSEFVGETRPLREWDPDIAARILAANHMLGDSETAAHVMWPRASDALRVMHAADAGKDPGSVLGGPKTYAFNNTLVDPNYPGAVIDSWMIQALSGREASDKGGAKIDLGHIDVHVLDQPNTTPGPNTANKLQWDPRGTVYTLMSAAVEQAASERGMTTSDAQAVLWYVVRDTGFTNMPPELMEAPAAPTDRAL